MIEISSTLQLPSFHIVGLPAPEVAEARERVRSAILSSDLPFPQRRVVLNLSPSSVRKQGTGIDLAMALAILQAQTGTDRKKEKVDRSPRPTWVAWGELGLDGSVKPTSQAFRAFHAAWSFGAERLVISREDLLPLRSLLRSLPRDLFDSQVLPKIHAVSDLREAYDILVAPARFQGEQIFTSSSENANDLDADSEEATQGGESNTLPLTASLERLLGVAAAGAHHLLLLGPRGSGKTQAMELLTRIAPRPTSKNLLLRCLLEELRGVRCDPLAGGVRRIGGSPRPAALIGSIGPAGIRPGELALAHGGIVLADEFAEWPRDSREALREPLESREITLSRARDTVRFPADFQWIGTANFCPCGGWDGSAIASSDGTRSRCICSMAARRAYLSRLSGPLLDRMDLVGNIRMEKDPRRIVPIAPLKQRVSAMLSHSVQRVGQAPGKLSAQDLEHLLSENIGWSQRPELENASSLRSRHKILRVALSLAYWDGLDAPTPASFMEAARYRWYPPEAGSWHVN